MEAMGNIPLFLLLVALSFGCGKQKDSFTVEIGPYNSYGPANAPWRDIEIDVPRDIGGKQISAAFRGLSFSDGIIATAHYSEDDELNDLCRIKIDGQKLYGACLNPSANDPIIRCFENQVFLDEADRTDIACDEVYGIFSEEEDFSCMSGTSDGQKAIRCTDGIIVLAYDYKTLCRIHTLTDTGRCAGPNGGIGHFQKTKWKGYGSEVLITGGSLLPLDLEDAPSGFTLKYETSSSSDICSVDDGSKNPRNHGKVNGVAVGDCVIGLTVAARRYVDKVFKITLGVEADVSPSFGQNANIADINTSVGVSVGAVVLPEAADGNGKLTYSIKPSLPSGIALDPATRELSGTPTAALSQTRFTYTVTDGDGDTDEIRFGVTVSKGQQSFVWPSNVYGANPSLSVGQRISSARFITGGRGNIEYRSNNEDVCTVTPNGFVVTAVGVGSCEVEARWTGDDHWEATEWAGLLLSSVSKGTQEFSWPSRPYGTEPSLAMGDSLNLVSPITGGFGTLAFRATGTSSCTVTQGGLVKAESAGGCLVEARWSGDDDWEATDWHELLSVTVGTKQAQTFAWPSNPYGVGPSLNVGATLALAAPITGGIGSLRYDSSATTVCTVSNGGLIRALIVGTCSISARWSGDGTRAPTPWQSLVSIEVGKGTQTYNWPSNPYGSNPSLAVGRSLRLRGNLPTGQGTLVFAPGGESGCSVDDDGIVTSASVGRCIVSARWSGDANWERTDLHELLDITVSQGTQNPSWPSNPYGTAPSLAVGGPDLVPADPPTDGKGDLTYKSLDTLRCTVDGSGYVSSVALGQCRIEARWEGDDDWLPSSWRRLLTITVQNYLGVIAWGDYGAATVGEAGVASPITLPQGASATYVRNSGSCSVAPDTGTVTAVSETTLEDCSVTVTVTRSGHATQRHDYTVTILP